jgi:hypothetical protein
MRAKAAAGMRAAAAASIAPGSQESSKPSSRHTSRPASGSHRHSGGGGGGGASRPGSGSGSGSGAGGSHARPSSASAAHGRDHDDVHEGGRRAERRHLAHVNRRRAPASQETHDGRSGSPLPPPSFTHQLAVLEIHPADGDDGDDRASRYAQCPCQCQGRWVGLGQESNHTTWRMNGLPSLLLAPPPPPHTTATQAGSGASRTTPRMRAAPRRGSSARTFATASIRTRCVFKSFFPCARVSMCTCLRVGVCVAPSQVHSEWMWEPFVLCPS